MKKINLLLSLPLATALVACNHNPLPITDSHTSEQALDWNGVYKGTLPCADCSGIETTVKLNNDKTYEKTENYLGKDNITFQEKGRFVFTDDGSKIILTNQSKEKNWYFVGENHLILLGQDGKPSTSSVADKYRLNKIQK